MKIAGVSIVRNAADIIAIQLLHHFSTVFDVMYIVDHSSTDGTDAVIARAARRFPIRWMRYAGHFVQGEITTELAHLAHKDGADWIVPVDSDEFWWTPGGDLRSLLTATDAAAIECDVVNFVQRRDVTENHPQGLLTMTRRPAKTVGSLLDAHELGRTRRAGFVEVPFPTKWIARASATLEIFRGDHVVAGVRGRRIRSSEIQCLHAPLRSKSVLYGRAVHGSDLARIDSDPETGWQMHCIRRSVAAGRTDAEWAANSYAGEALDVDGVEHPVIVDNRLRDICARWIDDEIVNGTAAAHADAGTAGGGFTTVTRRAEAVDVEMAERVRVAELHGLSNQLRSAISAVAARDAVIADLEATLSRIGRSLPGRVYKRLAKTRLVRSLVRIVTGLR